MAGAALGREATAARQGARTDSRPRGEGGFTPKGEGGFAPKGKGGFKPKGPGGFGGRPDNSAIVAVEGVALEASRRAIVGHGAEVVTAAAADAAARDDLPRRALQAEADDRPGRERAAIVEHLKTAIAQCPTVRGCRVGRRVQHGLAGYEQQMAEDYQFALMLDFDTVAGLVAYLQNPAHAGIGDLFTSAASASLGYDYEVVDLGEADKLL